MRERVFRERGGPLGEGEREASEGVAQAQRYMPAPSGQQGFISVQRLGLGCCLRLRPRQFSKVDRGFGKRTCVGESQRMKSARAFSMQSAPPDGP